jgi:hypothetical protein
MNNNNSIFPHLSGLTLAGKPIRFSKPKRRSPLIARHELKRLIADMVD